MLFPLLGENDGPVGAYGYGMLRLGRPVQILDQHGPPIVPRLRQGGEGGGKAFQGQGHAQLGAALLGGMVVAIQVPGRLVQFPADAVAG